MGAKNAAAAVAVFDGLGRLTNPEETFRHNNPPPKGRQKAPIPEVDACDLSGFPPLMRAVSANDPAEVTRLLRRKANPNVRNAYGRTPQPGTHMMAGRALRDIIEKVTRQ